MDERYRLASDMHERMSRTRPHPASFLPARRRTFSSRGSADTRVWYAQSGIEPAFASSGTSSRGLVIGLVWATGSNEVDVFGLDRSTLEEKWTSSAFPIAWGSPNAHLRVVHDRVLVSDDFGDVHVLDAKTGKNLRLVHFRARIGNMCAAADGSPRLLVRLDEGTDGFLSVDARTGVLTPAPADESCASASSSYETRLLPADRAVEAEGGRQMLPCIRDSRRS